ncbi:MAG: hypothetical protein D6803_08655, partial [Anaerolineae bacterium]
MATLLRALLNAGASPADAQVLDEYFANEPEFLDGLEEIARALAMRESPSLMPPAGEPWKTIHGEMLGSDDLHEAFSRALAQYPAAVQVALAGVVSQRMQEISDWLKEHEESRKQRKTADYIKALERLGYRFRLNLCDNSVEVNGEEISDPLRAEIRTKLRDIGIREVNVAEDAYLAEAWQNRYHPVREYLNGLQYDGQDHIGRLAEFFDDEQGVFGIWIRRWLIGAVAKAMMGVQNRMLILDGPQGIGKSYFVRWLGSALPNYYYEGPINPDSKDDRLLLTRKWIWEVTELGATTRRADREALKGFLSLQEVTIRKPYGRFPITKPALASFIGTVNNETGVLNDPTGSRRFMACTVTAIDWQYTKAVKVDDVWAQAFDLYIAGEPWELTADEKAQAEEINEYYTIEDPIQSAILKHFDVDPQRMDWWMPTIEIVQILEGKGYRWNSPRAGSMAVASAATG